ncbi:MAG TPA: hypothetical protein VGL61_13850 [Kofleriaceae bacterium]
MGATLDPKTGAMIWEARVPLDEQPAYYRAHPPRALAAFRPTPIDHLDVRFDGHGEPINSIFALACSCGGTQFYALAHVEDGELIPPIELECTSCESPHVVFDLRVHGYTAATGDAPSYEPSVEVEELATDELEIIVRFEQPSDTLGDPDNPAPAEDMFSWISVVGRDPRTGALAILFDYECA